MSFNLGDIRQTIRNVTASPDSNSLTDTQIDDYINKFYLYVLPDDMKPFNLLVEYKIATVYHQVDYAFDLDTYVALKPQFYLNGNPLLFYEDRSLWLQDFQYQYTTTQVETGDGVTVAFSGTLSQFPIIDGTLTIGDQVESFLDNGDGTLTGTAGGSGSINYATGAWAVTFNTAPASLQAINGTWAPMYAGRPKAIYYDGNGTINFSPIPDSNYIVEGSAYIQPTAFIEGGAGTQTPRIADWGYVISYGTSLEIFRQRGQIDLLAQYKPEYEKYLDLALSRSTEQSSSQRSVPKW